MTQYVHPSLFAMSVKHNLAKLEAAQCISVTSSKLPSQPSDDLDVDEMTPQEKRTNFQWVAQGNYYNLMS